LSKVRFLTTSAGAGGVIRPGDVIEVSESEAKILVAHGYAVEIEPSVKKPKSEPKPEQKLQEPQKPKKKTGAKKES